MRTEKREAHATVRVGPLDADLVIAIADLPTTAYQGRAEQTTASLDSKFLGEHGAHIERRLELPRSTSARSAAAQVVDSLYRELKRLGIDEGKVSELTVNAERVRDL